MTGNNLCRFSEKASCPCASFNSFSFREELNMKRLLVSIAAIFLAWMFIDTLSHRLLLHSLYESSPNIWRPLSEMNPVLIIVVTCVLILIFIATYRYLVKPKSLANGFVMGGLLGVALGTSSGFGTCVGSSQLFYAGN